MSEHYTPNLKEIHDVAAELDAEIAADTPSFDGEMSEKGAKAQATTIMSDDRLIGSTPTGKGSYKNTSKFTPSQLVLPCTMTQLQVFASRCKYQSLFTTRRWGKTTFACLKVIDKVKRANPLGLIWWVAPTYKQCKKPFRTLLSALHRAGLLKGYSRGAMTLITVTGWTIEFRSAEVPDNLRGEGVDLLIIDEQGQVSDEAWDECLFPTLADTDGDFLGIGTPKGRRGWAYKRFRIGMDPAQQKLYYSKRFTAYDAIFIPPAFLAEAKKNMPGKAFQQEFMAEFLDALGVVFENLREAPRLEVMKGEGVGVGADWAKKKDWTWFVATGERSGCIVDYMRLPQLLPYKRQVEALVAFTQRIEKRGHSIRRLVHDQTGVGEGVDELLRGSPLKKKFEGLTFTYNTKKDLVEEGIVAFEAGKLGLPEGFENEPDGERLLREHEDYSLEITKTGRVLYGAPDGLHDDAVVATLLSNRARGIAGLVPRATSSVRIAPSMVMGMRLFNTPKKIVFGNN